jgi:ornithine cyclodeaminase
MHINKIGGDSPGKTELDPSLIEKSKIVVELLEQTMIEGEIQQCPGKKVYAELWEIASGSKKGREKDEEITLFDSVGFALEDFSALCLVERLAKEHNIGHQHTMTPELSSCKDLFSLLS